ncbi:Maf family protein [Candidatus Protochlamydia phocaeensis]|uniref:Maf family protein n=1 Tax=Candidatus Protochlamydia phocaeensis TaxID=1414722 RepID=UPI000838F0FD|nr:Maf family protein [Candidatus Protochlamydia phocaeensis]
MHFILGSQSPRRREILSYFNLPFTQVASSFDEDAIPFKNNPMEYVLILSRGKAELLRKQYPDALILTADTIVYKDERIFGKPRDEQEAFEYLKTLAGHWHSVFTGLSLSYKDQLFEQIEETKVLFNEITDQQIRLYQQTLHCADKAGGYMIQGPGGLIAKRIEGCYYNVMGLPLNALENLLKKVGIDLWKHLKG